MNCPKIVNAMVTFNLFFLTGLLWDPMALLITLGLGKLLIGFLSPSTYEEGALLSSKLPADPQLKVRLLFPDPS